MAKIVAGIGSSHVPSIGRAYDNKVQEEAVWKPLFDGYKPVKKWLKEEVKPDVAIVVYNDHGTDFFFDKYPTFAIGVADEYGIGDEGFGPRTLPAVPGEADFSWHVAESLIKSDFDMTVCQEMQVDHGLLVPLPLLWSHEKEWDIKVVPLVVNVIQHPLPSAMRCFRLGQALRKAVESYPEDLRVVVIGTGGMSHQLHGERMGHMNAKWDNDFMDKLEFDPAQLAELSHTTIMEQAGAEAVELIMWLTMRGAMSPEVTRIHRNYYAPMTSGMGLVTFTDKA
ncbi:class III extradiol dioxygenase family protein [Eoetvoesiella caeni]|uniref:Protocatechuate 4,5-dioxygenase beta subunit n=1 Tax=Eoetvoesiella caeni TaxID=645616 RepID=A0A366HH01_9BURK|nr:class III extradiol dioxygenase family protein [Eoetvoesiella caeni]MCI2808449.1 class III extradiol dioxygenase family protein [Eoetvoesiella caeni]NYT54990.1 MEMO1 family protein [Eoetvoesiella caeni]RBP41038.1 protocatechuate 4,5-dioxygenase beta subunit [Eoetvoesiella caeni]